MSNKNLQKHLPRGLDEHNFQDGWKRSCLSTEFIQRVFWFCIFFSQHFWSSSLTLMSFTLSGVSWGSLSDVLRPLFSVALLVFSRAPVLQMDDLEILSILKDGSHWGRYSFSHSWSMLLKPPWWINHAFCKALCGKKLQCTATEIKWNKTWLSSSLVVTAYVVPLHHHY